MKKRNLLIAAGVVAAGVCIWLIARPSKGPKVLLETAPISHITIRNSVTATGTVEPVTEVGLDQEGDWLVIPASGQAITTAQVQEIRDADQR